MIVTFYSFKGGVGRTMALANVAHWLQRNGLRVVVVDWDLEAPGLENFFSADPEQRRRVRSRPGLMDLMTGYLARWADLPWPQRPGEAQSTSTIPETGSPTEPLGFFVQAVELLKASLPPLSLALQAMPGSPQPGAAKNVGALWLLSAGARDGENYARYADNVQGFDWARFYEHSQGEAFFEWLRAELNSVCDITLIDSRTGVTEMGGVCTRHMADVVIGMCAPNEANLAGTERIIDVLNSNRLRLARRGRALELIPVPARVDRQGENTRRNEWRDDFLQRMGKRLGTDAQVFWDMHIPYVPYYSFEEKLVVGEPDSNEDLDRAYRGLGLCIARRFAETADANVRSAVLARDGRQDESVHELLYSPELALEPMWHAVPEGQHAIMRRLLLRLVHLSPDDDDEVVAKGINAELLPENELALVETMKGIGLLRDEPARGTYQLQFASDDFVEWPRLRQWLFTERQFLLWRLQLDSSTNAWSASGKRDEGVLISSEALATAEAYAVKQPSDLLPVHLDFIKASRKFANRLLEGQELAGETQERYSFTRVFLIRSFGTKTDSKGASIDFDRVHTDLIDPALARCGLTGGTTAEVEDAGNIRADMFALIVEADLVICDITVHNANVFYELGIRHALRKKHTVLIKGDPSADITPFDLSTDRYLKYAVDNPAAALDSLVATLRASLRSNRETDSPIFLMLPTLAEADSAEVTVLPLDFIEEVERAEAASDKGWLRVIAEDLRGQRFQWDGLRCVARAQWSLKDLDGAQANWETLRNANDDDIEANLALANVYERQYRAGKRETLLESSNQAIRKVLDDERCTPAQRAEALALEGRNLKTMWRARIADAADPAAARQQALDARALHSYESYRSAFECDLNAFYPGLAALQMGHILRLLAELPGWRNLFKGDRRQAERAREDLAHDLPALTHVVAAAIKRARAQPHASDNDRLWADIADADLLFLTVPDEEWQADPSLLAQAYRDAIPPKKRFAWDATGGQLELFAQLGLRAEAVQAIMQAFKGPADKAPTRREHLVVFTGHSIDTDGTPPRFPAKAEVHARKLIAEKLAKLQQGLAKGEQLTVLASAAPGADILAHEVCAELKVTSRLCLPMPPDDVARAAFAAADSWRTRFHAVVKSHEIGLLQMADYAELPRWLQGRAIDPWERGNRWVLKMAQTWGAQRVTLLALWDGQETSRSGGTAQMVRLARDIGHFELDIIDSKQLLT